MRYYFTFYRLTKTNRESIYQETFESGDEQAGDGEKKGLERTSDFNPDCSGIGAVLSAPDSLCAQPLLPVMPPGQP